jgi:two-component system, cell cycle response regulator DivK
MNKKILVVEDHPDIRRLLTLSLRRQGYEIIETNTGSTAVTLVLSEKPDLVLLDLSLPDLSGLELARTIKQNPQTTEIPLVALSGYTGSDIANQALEAGMAEYLVKPTETKRLVEVIKKLTPAD